MAFPGAPFSSALSEIPGGGSRVNVRVNPPRICFGSPDTPPSAGTGAAALAIIKGIMRDPSIVEEELVSISAMADDVTRFDAIVAWCATHPDEIPLALHMLMLGRHKHAAPSGEAELHS